MPPSLPRLVTVIVEPDSSSRSRLAGCAPLAARRAIAAALAHRSSVCAWRSTGTMQAAVGLRRDAEVHRVVQRQHAGLVVEAGVDLREVAPPRARRADQEGQRRELAPRCAAYWR